MNVITALLQHHVKRAAAGAPYSALRNCHVPNLTSIVLHDEPGNRIRMFIAHPYHPLWRLQGWAPNENVALAIHPHHCDLTLIGLYGPAENLVYALTPNPLGQWQEFAYRSAITHGEPASFKATGARADMHLITRTQINAGAILQAHQLHTVYVPRGYTAAWLVIEGKPDPNYNAVCWSDGQPEIEDDCYEPMESKDVVQALRDVIREIGVAS